MRAIVLFLLAFLVTSISAQSTKIGYIDVEKVINSLPQYQHDNDSLIQQFEPKKQQLLDLFKHIFKKKRNYGNNSSIKKNMNLSRKLKP